MEDFDLDVEWVNELAECESAYDDFYEDTQCMIDCYVLAVDSHDELVHVSKTKLDVHGGVISSDAIAAAFRNNRLPRQHLEEALLFRVSASPDEVLTLHIGVDNTTIYSPGCDVPVGPSPKGLHRVNAVFLLGRERERADGTRRIRLTTARKTRRKHHRN